MILNRQNNLDKRLEEERGRVDQVLGPEPVSSASRALREDR